MATGNNASARPVSWLDVDWAGWDEGRFGERYRHLTRAAIGENYRVGVAIEELQPGKQSSPAHYHIFEEEHVYLLEGALTVRIGVATYEMTAGDYVCFPAGLKAGHCLINNSNATSRYVIVGENNPNEVAVYTDSNKVLVRSLGPRAIFDLAAWRDYWHGEDTGLPPPEITSSNPATVAADSSVKPISSADVEWKDTREGTRFGGRARHLTYAAVGPNYHVGMLIESPAPGRRLDLKHYHMLEEEHAFILEGQLTLLLGDEQYEMKAGDYICFPAGQKVGHSFLNSGSSPCSYLMIGEASPHDVCVYPDSNKLAVNALRVRESIFDMAALRNYWDGEQTG